MEIIHFLFLISVPLTTICHGMDPCSDTVYRTIGDLPKRSPLFPMNTLPICDTDLSGWYGAKHYKMPTSKPLLGRCGTLYPIWLKGEHPPEGKTTTATACKTSFWQDCAEEINIDVKNCGSFYVYHLKRVDLCYSAYCFEIQGDCLSDKPSNVSVSYHNISWVEYVNGVSTAYDPVINFKCSFKPLDDTSLFYEILWYVEASMVKKQTLPNHLLENALLTSIDMKNKKKKAGSRIYCLVGAKRKEDGVACATQMSPPFFAGIQVLNKTIEIQRGGTAEIQLRLTIPFADISIKIAEEYKAMSCLDVSLAPVYGSLDPCTQSNKSRIPCDIKIVPYSHKEREKYASNEWQEIYRMKIFNKDNLDFKDVNKRVTLRLQTGNTHSSTNNLLAEITLEDIKVTLYEPNSVWKGKECHSHADPHIKTFDELKYDCHVNRRYIMYRNENYSQEVQVNHHNCHPGHSGPKCICAVAARSGKDVFTVNVCWGTSFINYPLYEDKALKVIEENVLNYEVFFPTGTIVKIVILKWPPHRLNLNINIIPSPSDVGLTSGLCGVLDGNKENDLMNKDGKPAQNMHSFFNSWHVPKHMDLFEDRNLKAENFVSISETIPYVCTCKVSDEKVMKCNHEQDIAQIECNFGTASDCKYERQKYIRSTNSAETKRRKRDLSHLKKIMKTVAVDEMEFHDMKRQKRQIYHVRTEEEARDVCVKDFEESKMFATCRQYVSDLSDTAIDNCILDVMMIGDNNISKVHIEAALEQCSSLIFFNSTFQEKEPEVTHLIESLCPNNCSGNGECYEGNCTFDENFAGSDCSFDLLGLPNIRHISDFGLCDKSYEECNEITLYGEFFFEHMNTDCYITRKTIQEDGTHSQEFFRSSLEPRTLFEGYCPLSYSNESHWVAEFSFNASNDGITFTDTFNVYVYQSDCQEFKNVSGNISFTLKSGYCFIKGRCYIDGGTNRDNKCDLCNVTLDRYSWSFNPDHCLINGECYMDKDIMMGTNPCSVCHPSVDQWNWSNNPGYCFIDGICYFDDQTQKNNDCYKCNYTRNRTEWTFNEGHCLIDGQCYTAGESHLLNKCLMCDPNQSKTNWTLSIGYCFVNGSCMQDGEMEENNPCLMCNISISTESLAQNPAYCEIDGLCLAHELRKEDKTCLYCNTSNNRGIWSLVPAYCYIGDLCVANGEENDDKSCFYCNPTINRESWSLLQDFCVIDGDCIEHGSNEKNNDCKVCDAYRNNSVWQIKDGYCFIQDKCYKNSEVNSTFPCQICNSSNDVYEFSSNQAFCIIDGLCLANGQESNTKSCLYCNTSLSRNTWSFKQDFCMIDGTCIKHGSAEPNKDCRICNAYTNYSVWQIKDGHCFIEDTCFKDLEMNASYSCHICNSSHNVYEFSSNPAYCNIDGSCLADGQRNEAKPCLYCNTSLTRDIWSFNQDYCMINGTCIKHGSTEPNNDCRICDVFTNHSIWQIKNGHCYIQETCFKDLEINITYPCQICNSSHDVYKFSSNSEYCNISNDCVADGEKNKFKSCLYCNTSISSENWTFNKEYCMINGTCVKHGRTEPYKDCRICDVHTSNSVWQIKEGYCYIHETCFTDMEVNATYPCHMCNSLNDVSGFSSNPAYCNIGGLCVTDGQKNNVKDCLYCNTSLHRGDWSLNRENCLIDGNCVDHGKTDQKKDCGVCDSYTNNSIWKIKDGHCYIKENCFKDFEINRDIPCQFCNSSNNAYKFSPDTDCLASTEGKEASQESLFSNPIFIATVSLIAAVCFITILIIVIYRVKMKWTENWSIGNEERARGNVGLTLYKKVNTEDLPPLET